LYPWVWDATTIRGADVVISNKSGFCHGARAPGALHICYCLTPTRFVWQPASYVRAERLPRGSGAALRLLLPWLRQWDRAAAARVDRFVAISTAVQERIRRYYGRESEVIFPPVDTARFAASFPPASDGATDYHVVVARLVPYKEIDLAIRAFNMLGRNLVVIGEGRDRDRLEGLAGPTVRFLGRLPDSEVATWIGRSAGLIWPGVEDFGLAPVEAMAAGRPVIARRAGGVLDTVVEGETGVFFDEPAPEALARAVIAAETISWRPDYIRHHAAQFGVGPFRERFADFVASVRAGAAGTTWT
jgi:glycosyltransferase involved in cell wall biosynthesis